MFLNIRSICCPEHTSAGVFLFQQEACLKSCVPLNCIPSKAATTGNSWFHYKAHRATSPGRTSALPSFEAHCALRAGASICSSGRTPSVQIMFASCSHGLQGPIQSDLRRRRSVWAQRSRRSVHLPFISPVLLRLAQKLVFAMLVHCHVFFEIGLPIYVSQSRAC